MKWQMRILYTLVLFLVWSLLAYLYIHYTLGSPKREHSVTLEIKSGTSVTKIGTILEDNGLIRNDMFFDIYAWFTKKAKRLQAGTYQITPGMDLDQILALISGGKQHTYKLTVPEGYTVDQIAEKLEKGGFVSKGDFFQAVDKENYPYDFVQAIPNNPQRRHKLEGYLLPTTYIIPKTVSARQVVTMMLEEFQRKVIKPNKIMQENRDRVDQWVTIASLIEREGQAREELPRIAGVIYNRLEKGMRLQVDATIQYARGQQKNRLYYKDLNLDSPYNTYKIKGLPPGPIACPGKQALEAVLQPEKHEYLYYVTKKDGTGEHYFAKTFKEHENNIKNSKKEQAGENSPLQ